jgi:hypothetical protein
MEADRIEIADPGTAHLHRLQEQDNQPDGSEEDDYYVIRVHHREV